MKVKFLLVTSAPNRSNQIRFALNLIWSDSDRFQIRSDLIWIWFKLNWTELNLNWSNLIWTESDLNWSESDPNWSESDLIRIWSFKTSFRVKISKLKPPWHYWYQLILWNMLNFTILWTHNYISLKQTIRNIHMVNKIINKN